MSQGNPEAFPWGANTPTIRQRLIFAIVVGVVASSILYQKYARVAGSETDFDLVWRGALLLRQGRDPYILIGPTGVFHWDFPFLYPAPSILIALPFSFLSVHAAAIAFVFAGSAILAFGATRDGWQTLPMFGSAAFVDCALTAQWSPLLVAGLFFPAIAAFACAKPQIGLPTLAGSTSGRAIWIGIGGAVFLMAVSFMVLPQWFSEWFATLGSADHMKSALLQPPGFLILLVLLRWKRPESWLVLSLATIPQTLMWYSVLILLAFPRTYREACVLSLISSVGYFVGHLIAETRPHVEPTGHYIWAVLVCTTFLPTVAAILRRPNEGPSAAWMQWAQRRFSQSTI